eukprot:scaffold1474_cov256-Pinguiococcus_pyrenoidosus.AAC.30
MALEYVPGSQCVGARDESLHWDPAGHGSQAATMPPVEYVPLAHACGPSTRLEHSNPAGHARQLVLSAELYVPTLQSEHAVTTPPADADVFAQGSGSVEGTGQKLPDGQEEHTEAAARLALHAEVACGTLGGIPGYVGASKSSGTLVALHCSGFVHVPSSLAVPARACAASTAGRPSVQAVGPTSASLGGSCRACTGTSSGARNAGRCVAQRVTSRRARARLRCGTDAFEARRADAAGLAAIQRGVRAIWAQRTGRRVRCVERRIVRARRTQGRRVAPARAVSSRTAPLAADVRAVLVKEGARIAGAARRESPMRFGCPPPERVQRRRRRKAQVCRKNSQQASA